MAKLDHNIFLKYDGINLLWSYTESGTYEKVTEDQPSTLISGGDTLTFRAVSGIEKIVKIDDGVKGTKKMIKSKQGEGTDVVVAIINDTTIKDYIYKYNIKFKPVGEDQSITVDPEGKGTGAP